MQSVDAFVVFVSFVLLPLLLLVLLLLFFSLFFHVFCRCLVLFVLLFVQVAAVCAGFSSFLFCRFVFFSVACIVVRVAPFWGR